MSSSLPKILETGKNAFISNSQIIKIKTHYEKSTIYKCGERGKISSDQKRFFIALSLYPLSFFANTPFKHDHKLESICKMCNVYL